MTHLVNIPTMLKSDRSVCGMHVTYRQIMNGIKTKTSFLAADMVAFANSLTKIRTCVLWDQDPNNLTLTVFLKQFSKDNFERVNR